MTEFTTFSGALHKVANLPTRVRRRLEKKAVSRRKAKIILENERRRSLAFFSTQFSIDADSVYEEYLHSEFRSWFDCREKTLAGITGINGGVSSNFDCETLYLLVRALKPRIVVETGVLYGASSSHILEAMKHNRRGQLYSIDLPSEPNKPAKDFLVRDEVKPNWQLIIGDSKNELPKLLKSLNRIDLFFHDSHHRFEHMWWEYRAAYEYLRPHGVLSSHDVISGLRRNAFPLFCKEHDMRYRIFRNLGIAMRMKTCISSMSFRRNLF